MAKSAAVTRKRSKTAVCQASVTTKIMHDYRVEAPATDATKIGLVWNEASDFDLVSIGSDRALYHLYRDAGSTSGWSMHKQALVNVSDLTVLTAPGRPDRLFVIGKLGAPPATVMEMVRTADGSYQARSLGSMLMFSESLSVVPCGTSVVAVGRSSTPTYFHRVVAGILPNDAAFVVRESGNYVLAEKVVCLGRETNTWPHLTLITLRDGTLSSFRGVRETPRLESDAWPQTETSDPIRLLYLDCDKLALPPLPGVTDFAAVVTSRNEAMLLATDGSSSVYMLMGTFEASTPGLVRWGGEWMKLELTGAVRPSLGRVCAIQLPDGRTRVLMHETVSGNLWITGWSGPGVAMWDHAVNLGIGGRGFAASISHGREMAFATSDPVKGIHAWTRTSAGGWRSESVHIPKSESVVERRTRRVTLTLSDEDNSLVGTTEVSVSAAEDMAVTINGRACRIGPSSPATVTTRAGCVHVTGPVLNSLHAPKLTFTSELLAGGRLEVLPDQDVQDFMKNVTGQDLLGAVDPLTGVEILRGAHRTQEEAESVARSLREVAAMLDDLYAPQKLPARSAVRIKASRGVRFLADDADQPGARSGKPKGAWQLSTRGGKLRFKKLRPEAAAAARAQMLAMTGEDDLLGIDWGSLGESIVNGLSDLVDFLLEEGEVLLTVIINGVPRVIRFVAETAEQIYDLFTCVFDLAGAELGNVVGWLMKEVGFLFDWDKIKRTRDRLRGHYLESVLAIPQNFPDPASWEPGARDFLESSRTQVQSWIDDVRTQYAGETPFNRVIGPLPSFPSLFESGGVSLFPQATWLFEKAVDALKGLSGESVRPDIPGLAAAIEALSGKLVLVESSVLPFATELASGRLTNWMTNLDAFRGDTILPLLDFLASAIDTLVDVVETVLHEMLAVLHILWANVSALVAWLDREIYLPFLTAFYSAALGGTLSLFDLVSLCVAVPFSLIESEPQAWPQLLNWLDFTFVVWIPVNALVEAILVAQLEAGLRARIFTSIFLLVLAGGIGASRYSTEWMPLSIPMAMAALTSLVAQAFSYGKYFYALVLIILVFVSLIFAINNSAWTAFGAAILHIVGAALSQSIVVLGDEEPAPPQLIVGYAAVQALLAFGVAAIFIARHENDGAEVPALA